MLFVVRTELPPSGTLCLSGPLCPATLLSESMQLHARELYLPAELERSGSHRSLSCAAQPLIGPIHRTDAPFSPR
jgi:hypothetical protein